LGQDRPKSEPSCGWTQPNRVGWADVPAQKTNSWLLCMQNVSTITRYITHSNRLIIFHFVAERELLTFCMQMVNTAEEPEKGRRLPGVRERGGWANGGSWWPFSVSGDRR
jgi:hypothetical protein